MATYYIQLYLVFAWLKCLITLIFNETKCVPSVTFTSCFTLLFLLVLVNLFALSCTSAKHSGFLFGTLDSNIYYPFLFISVLFCAISPSHAAFQLVFCLLCKYQKFLHQKTNPLHTCIWVPKPSCHIPSPKYPCVKSWVSKVLAWWYLFIKENL